MKRCDVSFEDVVSLKNLCEAWQEFIRGKRKKKDVQEFQFRLMDEIMSLNHELVSGAYRHRSYHEFRINDPKPRLIHKASVRDRLLHHAIHRKLYPYFDARFITDSFSCRKGKGTHRAMNRFLRMTWKESRNYTRTCWVLKCDIRKFFASIDHYVLVHLFEQGIEDRNLVRLLGGIIDSFATKPGKGIPLGNLTSQLFANIYMDPFDQFVKHGLRRKNYVRYADDFVFLSRDRTELEQVLEQSRTFLPDHLALDLHPDKIFLNTIASGIDFLGWTHFIYHQTLRTKTKWRMIKRIVQNPTEATLQSYLGMLKHGDCHNLSKEILNIF